MFGWLKPPRRWTFVLLWLLWSMVVMAVLIGVGAYVRLDRPVSVDVLRWLRDPKVLVMAGIPALVFARLQFAGWKCAEDPQRRRAMRVRLGVLIALGAGGMTLLAHVARTNNLKVCIWGSNSMPHYEQLANNGQWDELVRDMEEDCAIFNRAKQKLDGDIDPRSYNHGFSYLFCYTGQAWDSIIHLAPMSVLGTLQVALYDASPGSRPGAFGPAKPLTDRLKQSDTLILRSLGSFMDHDMATFAEASYALAKDDPDALPLAAFASLRDPDKPRGIEHMLDYHAAGAFDGMPYMDDLTSQLQKRAAAWLASGEPLDPALKARVLDRLWPR